MCVRKLGSKCNQWEGKAYKELCFLEGSFHSFYLLFVASLTVDMVFVLSSVNRVVAMKAVYWYPKHLLLYFTIFRLSAALSDSWCDTVWWSYYIRVKKGQLHGLTSVFIDRPMVIYGRRMNWLCCSGKLFPHCTNAKQDNRAWIEDGVQPFRH